MVTAVIFDLDGVIADSEPLSGEATGLALEKYGIKMTDKERNEAFGRRTKDIVSGVLKVRGVEINIDDIIAEKDRIFRDLILGKLEAIPNSIELVRWLRDKGFKLALATSSHKEKMKLEVSELGVAELFDTIVTGDDVRKGKPNPEIFLKAAKKLDVKPEHCAVIEDSQFGVQAAKTAGMKTIAFDSPNTHNQDLSMADVVVKSLEDVRKHVK